MEVARLAGLPGELTENAMKMLRHLNRNETSILEEKNGNGKEMEGPSENQKKILQRLRKTDVNALTPLEALNMLSIFAEELRDEQD
ncbi:DNA mismatch repair protein MutS [bioreactor metagenome]|uniref:DNA mismatch repair protein MutS n=1 Tax=bioreactor metagenome TaxID=1076179 RepID=A0A645GCZ1_9ZZZZ